MITSNTYHLYIGRRQFLQPPPYIRPKIRTSTNNKISNNTKQAQPSKDSTNLRKPDIDSKQITSNIKKDKSNKQGKDNSSKQDKSNKQDKDQYQNNKKSNKKEEKPISKLQAIQNKKEEERARALQAKIAKKKEKPKKKVVVPKFKANTIAEYRVVDMKIRKVLYDDSPEAISILTPSLPSPFLFSLLFLSYPPVICIEIDNVVYIKETMVLPLMVRREEDVYAHPFHAYGVSNILGTYSSPLPPSLPPPSSCPPSCLPLLPPPLPSSCPPSCPPSPPPFPHLTYCSSEVLELRKKYPTGMFYNFEL